MKQLLNSKHTFDGSLTVVLNSVQYTVKNAVINIGFFDDSSTIQSFDLMLKIEDDKTREDLSKIIPPLDVKAPKDEYTFTMAEDKLELLGKEYRKDLDVQQIIKVGDMACFYLDNYRFVSYN